MDNGGSWTVSPFSNGAYSLSSDGGTIYLGSGSKVFKSTDMGATWIDVSTGLGHGGIQALLYDGKNLIAGTPGGFGWNIPEHKRRNKLGSRRPRGCRSAKISAV